MSRRPQRRQPPEHAILQADANSTATEVAEAEPQTGKTSAETAIVMSRSMQPPDANVWGNVHGGAITRMADEAGGAVAVRHSRRPCVTVTIDSMTFKQPVYIGDLLTIHACLTYTGRTSMEIEATIQAENLRTGAVRHAGTSYLVYVALDDEGEPTPVPPLIMASADEERRWRDAKARREVRTRAASAHPAD